MCKVVTYRNRPIYFVIDNNEAIIGKMLENNFRYIRHYVSEMLQEFEG